MKPTLFNKSAILLQVIFALVLASAEFPLENPCLQTCANDALTATVLQKCIDKCQAVGHCCGNRLNGECPDTSAMKLSCANGCEIAYYRSKVADCKADCDSDNRNECEYRHPNIPKVFTKCRSCQNGCDKWPDDDACRDGCDFASQLPEFYNYVEIPEGTCDQDDIPRFLFAGQSNMEGWSEQALPGSFKKVINIVNKNKPKKKILNLLKKHLMKAEVSELLTSRNEARYIYSMRKHLKKKQVFNDHPTSTCSFTDRNSMVKLDCEQPLSSNACGGGREGYGSEFMFGHVFPKLKSPLKGKSIGITKVAKGGTEIYKHWMKETKDDETDGTDDQELFHHWYPLVDAIKGAKGSIEAFVWFQGENDSFKDWNMDNYFDNLTQFIADVRQEIFNYSAGKFSSPDDIPVIIVELGGWIYDIDTRVPDAQNKFVENDPNAVLVKTGGSGKDKEKMTKFFHFDAASLLIIGKRIAQEMAKILTENDARRNARIFD